MERSRNKFRGLPLVPDLRLHTYVYLWTKLRLNFFKRKSMSLLVWYSYTVDVFFIQTHGKEKLGSFLEDLNKFYPNIKFSHEVNKESIHFLDLIVRLSDGKISTDLLQTSTNFSTTHNLIQITPSYL